MILKVYSGDIPTEETEIEYLEDNLPGYTIIRGYEYDHASNIVMLVSKEDISGDAHVFINTKWYLRWKLSMSGRQILRSFKIRRPAFNFDKITREVIHWNRVEKIENLLS